MNQLISFHSKKRTAPDFRQERLGIISVQLILGDGSLNILGLLTLGRGTTVSELDPVSDDLSELTTDTILLVVPGLELADHSDFTALRHVLRNKDGRITPTDDGGIIRLCRSWGSAVSLPVRKTQLIKISS